MILKVMAKVETWHSLVRNDNSHKNLSQDGQFPARSHATYISQHEPH